MRVEVIVKEQSYGIVTIEVPDDATEDDIYEMTDNAYSNGRVFWHDENFEMVDWKKV